MNLMVTTKQKPTKDTQKIKRNPNKTVKNTSKAQGKKATEEKRKTEELQKH